MTSDLDTVEEQTPICVKRQWHHTPSPLATRVSRFMNLMSEWQCVCVSLHPLQFKNRSLIDRCWILHFSVKIITIAYNETHTHKHTGLFLYNVRTWSHISYIYTPTCNNTVSCTITILFQVILEHLYWLVRNESLNSSLYIQIMQENTTKKETQKQQRASSDDKCK